ncbi:MAG TPA: hypothetical protein VFG83_14970 [Kofleriaceae bacterium]|nr:hypothetical protein [Kofleriaceae bacterium]
MSTALILATGALCACGGTTTHFTQTNLSPVPMHARDPASVQVFMASRPQRPFVEVGIVEAQQSSRYSRDDMRRVVWALREEAARRGCDGLIIVGNNNAVVGGTYKGYGGTSTLKGYRGACIMYKPAWRPAPALRAQPAVAPAAPPANPPEVTPPADDTAAPPANPPEVTPPADDPAAPPADDTAAPPTDDTAAPPAD